MSESDGEQVARSLALEQAYVHEVYDQCAESTVHSRHWPRIYQFLEDLEPGALVCDVGCGNGKYLNVTHSVFNVGVDRCKKLTDIARENDNEVLVCDNLSLPFRDESFDAVLSIAVVHHFSTTERRVRALKELARVLRIGGRLIISVWAMEQRHRKFESQDVLIPWPKACCLDSTSNPIRFTERCYSSCKHRNHITQGHSFSSERRSQQRYKRGKGYWIDPILSSSPSTSSLSSPNETCYSFFRRALQMSFAREDCHMDAGYVRRSSIQAIKWATDICGTRTERKLAGGRRGSRPWFLESWQSGVKNRRYCERDDEDDNIDDIPIELRRLEDTNTTLDNKQQNDNLSVKSKSLCDILEVQRLDLVRSRSSIPGLCSTVTSYSHLDEQSIVSSSIGGSKPKLVKQKSHLVDDNGLKTPDNTAIQRLLSDLPDFQDASNDYTKRGNVYKQSSMNEELMFIDRLQEKERVKQNITKQASLNEEIICKGRTFEALKDSIYSGNATKRLQLLTSGITNKIKQSTTNIDKVSGMSIRNGFVKILQSWKSIETEVPIATESSDKYVDPTEPAEKLSKLSVSKREEAESSTAERRLSREDGSDSSKDSSLQSDTSVDSEDSFASVIYVPKPQPQPQSQPQPSTTTPFIDVATVTPRYQPSIASAPPSPRVKYPPQDLSCSRMKLITISPLLQQFPATSKSLPPPSPPGLSPRTINSTPLRPFFDYNAHKPVNVFDKVTSVTDFRCRTPFTERVLPWKSSLTDEQKQATPIKDTVENISLDPERLKTPPKLVDTITPSVISDDLEEMCQKRKSSVEIINEEESRKARLSQVKELLRQKPDFATRTRPSFPLVRRASSAVLGRMETNVTKVLPRLLSLELFNPETDDLDSDSSDASSPESAGSVISVISDERYLLKKENAKTEEAGSETSEGSKRKETEKRDNAFLAETINSPSLSPHSMSLTEAVPCTVALKKETNKQLQTKCRSSAYEAISSPNDTRKLLRESKNESRCMLLEGPTSTNKFQQRLVDSSEKLSENLIYDIDQYCRQGELGYIKGGKEGAELKIDELSRNGKLNGFNEETASKQPLTLEMVSSGATAENVPCVSSMSDSDEYDNKTKSGSRIEKYIPDNTHVDEDILGSNVGSRGKFTTNDEEKLYSTSGNSIESSDIGDSVENTISESSQEELSAGKMCSISTTSLGSNSAHINERHRTPCHQTTMERMPSRVTELKNLERSISTGSSCTLSNSSSQESLPSDPDGGGGSGAITYHQYYHVFREGELDQLINKYVENLHIISSYYDHASWCIVAEKVQVWTI